MPEISALGEKAYLRRLLPRLTVDPTFVNGFGHDASVIDLDLAECLVLKTDRCAVPIASTRGWANAGVWGRLAATATCSDILACGGTPRAVVLAVSVPRSWPVSAVDQVILACERECRAHGVAFVGGDTKESSQPHVVCSGVGSVARDRHLPRSGARAGDLIVVAGLVGGFLGSYLQLVGRTDLSIRMRTPLIRYLSRPSAKWAAAGLMRELGIASACMDNSDGLFETVTAMAGNELGIELNLASLPLHPAALECERTVEIPALNCSFGSGDWNLVFAVDPQAFRAKSASDPRIEPLMSVIGTFTQTKGIVAVDHDGARYRLEGLVNEHFRARMEDEGDYMEQARHLVALSLI